MPPPPPPLERHYIGLLERPEEVAATAAIDLKHTELRLGLPGGSESQGRSDGTGLGLTLGLAKSCASGAKRGFSFSVGGKHLRLAKAEKDDGGEEKALPSAKARAIGWPPIRSYRKNTMAGNPAKNKEDQIKQGAECLYIKVSMDGAPYLRKVDLRTHSNYQELSLALEKMFTRFSIGRDVLNEGQGSEYVLTYEDKDGDWMLVGDVPWEMFTCSCRRLRIMKGSDAIGEIQEQEVTMAEDQRN